MKFLNPFASPTPGATAAKSEQVAALFAAAGLDLDAMLEAGPDALKAHLAGVGAKDGELAAAQAKIADQDRTIAQATATITTFKARLDFTATLFETLGITNETKPEAFDDLLTSYVKKRAALVLAGTGHAPVTEIPVAPAVENLTGSARAREYFRQQNERTRMRNGQ